MRTHILKSIKHYLPAEVGGALVLLGVGSGPAGEGDEVSEAGVAVVVRVPVE